MRRRSRRPPPAGRSRTPPGRRCPGPRRRARGCGCGTAWRRRRRPRSGPAARSDGTEPVKTTIPATPVVGPAAPGRPVRPAADDQQRRVGHPPADLPAGARISVSWPLRGTSRETQTTTGRSVSPSRARTCSPSDVGVVRRPRRRRAAAGAARPRPVPARGDPAAGVLAEVGDHVDAPADAAQRPAGRPAAPPSRPRGRGSAPPPGGRRPVAQRRRRAAPAGPRRRTSTVSQPCARASRGRPAGDHAGWAAAPAVRSPDHLERLVGVELRGAPPAGRVDDDASPARLADREVVHEGLDAAGAGREVVGDQQGAAHEARP